MSGWRRGTVGGRASPSWPRSCCWAWACASPRPGTGARRSSTRLPTPRSPRTWSEARGSRWARSATQPASNYSPGLPLLAAGVYELTGGVHERSARLVLALIGTLAVLFAYLIGRRLSGPSGRPARCGSDGDLPRAARVPRHADGRAVGGDAVVRGGAGDALGGGPAVSARGPVTGEGGLRADGLSSTPLPAPPAREMVDARRLVRGAGASSARVPGRRGAVVAWWCS